MQGDATSTESTVLTLEALLDELKLAHLCAADAPLAAMTLDDLACHARLQLLQELKRAGVTKLSERQAVTNGVAKAVREGRVVIRATSVVEVDAEGALLRAAANGDIDAVQAALERCGTKPTCDRRGTTACMAAAENGHEHVLRVLLESGAAHVNAQRPDGMTAIMLATKRSQHGCLGLLLHAAGDATLTTQDAWSALMMACEANDAAAVALLLAGGASPTDGLHNGWGVVLTPLKLACIGGHASCVELLLGARVALDGSDGSGLDIVESDGSTMLIYAAQRTRRRAPQPGDGYAATVNLLLAARADPDQSRWDGITPLAYAVSFGDEESTQLLLDAQAAPSAADEAGWTPVLWGALRGHTACVRRLCDHGAAANESRPNGYSALHMAALCGSEACLRILLSASANVDAAALDGSTPLIQAAIHGHEDAARCLLEARASLAHTDGRGWTAAEHAAHKGHVACRRLLSNAEDDLPYAATANACSESIEPALAVPVPVSDAVSGDADELACVQFAPLLHLSHLDSWHERTTHAVGSEASATPSAGRSLLPLQYYCGSTHPHFANVLQCILLEHGLVRTASFGAEASLHWVAGQVDPLALRELRPGQLINKFPATRCLTTKSSLWGLLERMLRKHGEAHYGFAPRSFVLPEQASQLHAQMQADAPEAVWVVKPVAACRGQGISLHWSAKGLPDDVATRHAIACRYVHPPYLLEGRKLDLRLYVLVTSWRPLVVYLHREGLARLAAEAYSLGDLANVHKHLTNYAINKHATRAAQAATAEGATPPLGSKLSLADFRRRLETDVGAARAQAAWAAVEDALVKTLLAAESTVAPAVATYVVPGGGRCFQLFGFDVLLDAALHPHVLEVNLDPSLATDSALDLQVKGAVLTDLLNLVGVRPLEVPPLERRTTAAPGECIDAAEERIVRTVDAELERARGGGWARLHPGGRDYSQLVEPSYARVHSLGFARVAAHADVSTLSAANVSPLSTAMPAGLDVLRPGEASYAEWLAKLPSATSGSRRPLAVVMPSTTSDVQRCMLWAAEHNKTVTVVGGGHSDHCVWDEALAIDLRPGLGAVQLTESNLLVAGGGCSMAAIAKAAEAGGRMCCLGTAPSVGVGLLLQGGVGHLARWRGLAVDQIQRLECVTPDGKQRTLSRADDLFWAFCGAAPNFGVVVHVVLRTFPLVPVRCAELHWSSGAGAKVSSGAGGSGPLRQEERALLGYASAASRCELTQTMDAMLHWTGAPQEGWRLTLVVSTFEWEGGGLEREGGEREGGEPPESRAAPHAAHASPLLSTLRAAMVSSLGNGADADAKLMDGAHARCTLPSELFAREYYLRVDPTVGLAPAATASDHLHFWVRCAFLPSPLTAEAAAILCAAVRDAPNRACCINLQHTGGAAARPACEHAIAFSHRGWEWSVVVTGVHRAADEQAVHAWVLATIERLLPLAVGTYTVDLGPTDGALAAHAFDEVSAVQLRSLKRACDPNQLLAHCLPLIREDASA